MFFTIRFCPTLQLLPMVEDRADDLPGCWEVFRRIGPGIQDLLRCFPHLAFDDFWIDLQEFRNACDTGDGDDRGV